MRYLAVTFVSCATLLGCVATPRAKDSEQSTPAHDSASLVGTWRLVSMTEANGKTHRVNEPFLMRFYANGDCASWPTPIAPISRGKYAFVDGRLSLPDAPGGKSVPLRLTENEMSYSTDQGGCVFRRVTPDLEPGQLP